MQQLKLKKPNAPPKPEFKKVTVWLPADLLEQSQKYTGEGITPTIRQALKHLSAAEAYKYFLDMRGKYNFSIDINELRKDRR